MVLVMNNDFNMERKEDEKGKSMVVNEGGNNEFNLNEEVRVCSVDEFGDRKCEIDENRVWGGYHANGISGVVEGVRGSLSNHGVDGDLGGEFGVENLEAGDVEKGGNEMGECEAFGFSGIEMDSNVVKSGSRVSLGEVSGVIKHQNSEGGRKGENEVGIDEASGSRGHRNLDLLVRDDFGGGGDDEPKRRDVCRVEWVIDGNDGDFKGARQGDLTDSASKDASGGDTDGTVVRSVSSKLLGTEFEMGDMVWGKVKSHPWWPGHLFDEVFASSSVRHTRKDGYLLVAFFGDSSYRWFAPSELIPYGPHFAEKSQQTTSRNFMRAVEDSVGEASRRSALALSCRCRNPSNFRPANVPGYLEVDIVGYEPGAVYSRSQIQKARDAFLPAATLAFLLQSAVAPMGCDSESFDFVRNKAFLYSYRRYRYEESDVTYAEAFASFLHKGVRPFQLSPSSTDKEPTRAPLSGPLVFAETPVTRKSSNKAAKPKEQTRKDRYLFKCRDEYVDLRTSKLGQDVSLLSSAAYEDGTSGSGAAGYVFQKRDQGAPVDEELGESSIMDQVETSASAVTSNDIMAGRTLMLDPDIPHKRIFLGETATSELPISDNFLAATEHNSSVPFTGVSLHASGGRLKKKKKAPKRPASGLTSENPEFPKKKIKKPKKSDGGRSSEHIERTSAESANLMGKPIPIVASTREDAQKGVEAMHSNLQHEGLVALPTVGENEVDMRQILADLHGLALNSCHGMEGNGPAVARQFLLKVRSLVFLKGSSVSAATESEHSEVRAPRFLGIEATDSPTESGKTAPSLKSSKLSAKNGDPTKGGRKRIPSERQEEIAVKRAKKITDVKSLSAEKRALLKNPELQRSDGKSKLGAHSPHGKPIKAELHGKKAERPPRVEEPTYLVMKFQSGSSLPSLAELKARFARFGSLDTSLCRVFYTTNTCRVAFLYKQDAHVAYRYAVGSKSVFSNVKFLLKPVAAPESHQPSSGRTEELPEEPVSNWDSPPTEAMQAALAALTQPVQRLRSCLKKPSGSDEPGGANNGGVSARTPRVRFIMAEGESSASNKGGPQVQSMESRNPVLSSYEGPPPSSSLSSSSSSSSSVAMDVNNNQRFMSPLPLQPPLFPHPPNLLRLPVNNQYHHLEVTPRTNLHEHEAIIARVSQVLPPPPPLPAPSADISREMMSLLRRCHDVVTNVKSLIGCVPYHPL